MIVDWFIWFVNDLAAYLNNCHWAELLGSKDWGGVAERDWLYENAGMWEANCTELHGYKRIWGSNLSNTSEQTDEVQNSALKNQLPVHSQQQELVDFWASLLSVRSRPPTTC